MNWITNEIAIGNYREAQDQEFLHKHRFHSVLSLDGTLSESQASQMSLEEIITILLIDGEGNDIRQLRLAVESLTELAQLHAPVLVQCHAGRSRSVIVVAGYLVQSHGMDAEEAIAFISSKREIHVTPCLKELLYRL